MPITLQPHDFTINALGGVLDSRNPAGVQPNRSPVIATIPDQTRAMGSTFSLASYFSDPDGDALTCTRTGGTAPAGVTVSTAGTVTVSMAVPAGSYTVSVSVDDGRGGSASRTFNLSVFLGAPVNLAATALSSSSIGLTWNAVAGATYRVYRGGVQIAAPTSNSYTDTGLAANTQYTYTVSAAVGASESAQSASSSATTQAAGGGVAWAPNFATLGVGMTTLVDRQWNPTDSKIPGGVLPPAAAGGTVDDGGMMWLVLGTKPLINTRTAINSASGLSFPPPPDGHSTFMALKYPSGMAAGSTQVGLAAANPPSAKKVYLCCYVCLPASFNSNANNIKWVFFAQNGSRNHVFMLSSGSPGSYRGPWMALQGGGNGSDNVGGSNNTHAGAIVNLASPTLTADGQWHCVEWYVQMETVNGTPNGVYRCYIDGTLVGHWNNIHFSDVSGDPSVFDTCWFAPYYGGGGGSAPSDQYIGVGRFFMAAGN